MTVKNRFGADSLPYLNSGTFGSPVYALLTATREVTTKISFSEADAKVKGTQTNQREPTLIDIDLELTMIEDEGDTTFTGMRASFYSRSLVGIGLCSGIVTVPGENLLLAEYKVFNLEKAEPWEDFNTYKFTLKPCKSANNPTSSTTV